jgi:hypothetical protein
MNTRSFLIVAILAIATTWWIVRSKSSAPLVPLDEVSVSESTPVSVPPLPSVIPDASPAPTGQPTPTPKPGLSIDSKPEGGPKKLPLYGETPSLEKMREEAAKDPHGTPRSVLAFSSRVGGKVRAAQSSREGEILFRDLQSCVQHPQDELAHSIHAICLLNARKLSEKFPELRGNYDDLARQTNPRVLKLIQGIP